MPLSRLISRPDAAPPAHPSPDQLDGRPEASAEAQPRGANLPVAAAPSLLAGLRAWGREASRHGLGQPLPWLVAGGLLAWCLPLWLVQQLLRASATPGTLLLVQALASGVCLAGWAALAHRAWQLDRQRHAAAAAAEAEQQLTRHQALFAHQADQLESMRRQAHADALTGLPNRRHFIALLDEHLCAPGAAPQAGLLLLRLRDLQGINQRIGHGAADRLIKALAQALHVYPQRIDHCFAGRLNGSDFALLLPTGGLAAETAASLRAALQLPLSQIDARAQVAIGAVEVHPDHAQTAAQALSLADAALAQAEVNGGLAVDELGVAPVLGEAAGEGAWLRRIGRALALGRVELGEFPVCTADGRRLHLDCPLRVQLTADGPFEPAQRWLSLAVRSQLSAQVDEKALALALEAIARDGQARCVNVSAQALGSPEFVASVTRRLESAPDAACRLWIDVPESVALERPMLVREVSRRWRPLGAMVALEHAGEGLLRIHRLIDLGLDCVRIDGRFVNGIADPAADDARQYLAGLVRLVQSVGLQVTAEGVRAAEDLEVLWSMGFDAATGPALRSGVDIELPDSAPIALDLEQDEVVPA